VTVLKSNQFTVSVVSTAAPAYLAGMADYEVRALTGGYAPTNGNTTNADVIPAEWQAGGTGTRLGTYYAFSGGFSDEQAGLLYVHGGGHGDSANNGIYYFDVNGVNAPTGWSLVPNTLSAVADVPMTEEVHTFYNDGLVGSTHSYDGMVFDPDNKIMYRFGGSPWRLGTLPGTAFKFDIATTTWTQLQTAPFSGQSPATARDPVTGKIFLSLSTGTARIYNPIQVRCSTTSALFTILREALLSRLVAREVTQTFTGMWLIGAQRQQRHRYSLRQGAPV
jgi:hypothetical protein